MTFPIKWQGEPHPEHEEYLRQDLIETLGLEPGDDLHGLMFHICLLTGDDEGPSIDVSYDPETGGVIAEYSPTTTWTNVLLDGAG